MAGPSPADPLVRVVESFAPGTGKAPRCAPGAGPGAGAGAREDDRRTGRGGMWASDGEGTGHEERGGCTAPTPSPPEIDSVTHPVEGEYRWERSVESIESRACHLAVRGWGRVSFSQVLGKLADAFAGCLWGEYLDVVAELEELTH